MMDRKGCVVLLVCAVALAAGGGGSSRQGSRGGAAPGRLASPPPSFGTGITVVAPQLHGIRYPIVFVESPRNASPPAAQGPFWVPQVAFPEIGGAAPNSALHTRESTLKMLHPNGVVEDLWGTPTGAVLYPSVSFDGRRIYFAFHPDLTDDTKRFDVYRMDWTLPGRPTTNLTAQYARFSVLDEAGNGPHGVTQAQIEVAQNLGNAAGTKRPIKVEFWNPIEFFDADGRVRLMCISTIHAERQDKVDHSQGDLVVMNGEDGRDLRTYLQVYGGAYFLFQSPTGQVYWGENNHRFTRHPANNFSLMLCDQDGTFHRQFDRFHMGFTDIAAPIRNSQSPSVNGIDIVTGIYYGGNLGFGFLQAIPDDLPGIDFSTNDAAGDPVLHFPIVRKVRWPMSWGPQSSDPDGPNAQGKLRDPAPAEGEKMLVSYSDGPSTMNMPGGPDPWTRYSAGIHLVPTGTTNPVTSPSQLVLLYKNPDGNALMPREVAPYHALYGIPYPALQPNPNRNDGASGLLPPGSAYAIARGASLLGETAPAANLAALNYQFIWNGTAYPKLWNPGISFTNGGWPLHRNFQGFENGNFAPSDIRYLRVMTRKRIPAAFPFLYNGYTGYGEANTTFKGIWEILGEFDVRAWKTDPNDTSYKVKIPANTPVMFQALDRFGMTITSETFLREEKPGATLTCGGCHAKGIEGVNFASTEASNPDFPLHDATASHSLVVPDFASGGGSVSTLSADRPIGVFFEEVKPLFQNCVSCHSASAPGGAAAELDLRDTVVNGKDLYRRLAYDFEAANPEGYDPVYQGGRWHLPNVSRFVKAGSARESLVLWKLVGPLLGTPDRRLDGRTNASFPTESPPGTLSLGQFPPYNLYFLTDVDNLMGCQAHTLVQNGTIPSAMVARLARWIDLGCAKETLSGSLPAYKTLDKDWEPPALGLYLDRTESPPVVHASAWDDRGVELSSVRLRVPALGFEAPVASLVAGLTEPALASGVAFPSPVPLSGTTTFELVAKDTSGNIRREAHDSHCVPEPSGPSVTVSNPSPPIGASFVATATGPFAGQSVHLVASLGETPVGNSIFGPCAVFMFDELMLAFLSSHSLGGVFGGTGAVSWTIPIPNHPLLAGLQFRLGAAIYNSQGVVSITHPPVSITIAP